MKLATARITTLGIAASTILAGSTLAQNPADSSKRPAVEPPRTTGQAPREAQAPIGHRQPAAKDVPPAVNEAPPSVDRGIDRRLNICRGCSGLGGER